VFGLTADVDKHMARVARLKAKKINGNGAGIPLAVEVRRWPTPKATDGDRGGRGDLLAIVRDKPNAHTGSWPTPTARDWKDGSFSPNVPENGLLGRVVWRTPQAGDGNGGGQDPEKRGDHSIYLRDQVKATHEAGSLNPDWVELLMGFPAGWTTAGPLPQDPNTTGSRHAPSPDVSPIESVASKPAATRSSRRSSK